MAKLLHARTKKNQALVKKLLDNQVTLLNLPIKKTITGSEALIIGNQCLLNGQTEEALAIADTLVIEFPSIIDTHLLKLNALIRLEHLVEAKPIVESLKKQAPKNLGVLQNSARLHMLCNQSKKAIDDLQKALTLSPGNADLIQILGECYEQYGDTNKAIKAYEKAIEIAMKKNNLYVLEQAFFQLSSINGLNKEQQEKISLTLESSNDSNEWFSMAFAQARSARKAKNIEQEIHWLKIANKMMNHFETSQGKQWNKSEIADRSKALKSLFNKPNPDWMQGFTASRTESPIFILAMPRSGTTLLEQILGSHHSIGQTGESRALNNATQKALQQCRKPHAVFPYDLNQLSVQQLEQITRDTMAHENLLTDQTLFVNKNLSNHLYAGLIMELFPNAKCIYLRRGALDNCLSIYQHQILNASYSTTLVDILHAQSVLEDLAQHWQQQYPERVYILNYEALASDGATALPPLINFLGLEWSDEILQFHERNNLVRTPSVNQVREKLNTKAINKWREYESLLSNVIPLVNKE